MSVERRYKPPIPENLEIQYETSLSKVPRWVGNLLPAEQNENDLEHINGMFHILERIETIYPNFIRTIDVPTVEDMIYIHDAGEILAGDLPMSLPDYEQLRPERKRKERIATRLLIRKIPDKDIRMRATNIYERYDTCALDDKEALLARLIDKVQGARFGLDYVFKKSQEYPEELPRNVAIGMGKIKEFAVPLLNILDGNAKTEFTQFIKGEIENFRSHGFTMEAESALTWLNE